MKIALTGAAGFIGAAIAKRLLQEDHVVIGVDNINDYYDISLKQDRLDDLTKFEKFSFAQVDIADKNSLEKTFSSQDVDCVLHLAAQAGVRYSLENPHAYVQSNIVGFVNVLELCRNRGWKDLIYASSSSVYGEQEKVPFSEADRTDKPVSLYAATKKSDELLAHSYAHLFGLRCTAIRFFTVYGPWGRPDMAYFKFTERIYRGQEIEIYGDSRMQRDFTFIADAVEGLRRILDKVGHDEKGGGHRVFNLGNSHPEKLEDFVQILEKHIGKKAIIKRLPIQPGDVTRTFADMTEFENSFGKLPRTSLDQGLQKFVGWYKQRYPVNLE